MQANGHERLPGKRALITGGSSGIGAATARLFVEHGANVVLVARRTGPLDALVAELGSQSTAIPADVAKPEQARDAVNSAFGTLGGLDVIVNSAGVAWPVSLSELDTDGWQQVIDINLSGTFYIARDAGLRMKDGDGGTIINLASELSVVGMEGYVAYCASKAGVLGLTRALAAELAPAVTVNAVCPGPVDTPMLAAEFETSGDAQGALEATLERVPLGRLATADEVASAILYLAADASYATGTTLELDGGTTVV
jgi:NAD(P)-dependent dehydrogenase (short-subunit alcohol dehydrogenase family)